MENPASPPTSSPGAATRVQAEAGVTLASPASRGVLPLKSRLHCSVSFSPSVEHESGDLGPQTSWCTQALQPPPR